MKWIVRHITVRSKVMEAATREEAITLADQSKVGWKVERKLTCGSNGKRE